MTADHTLNDLVQAEARFADASQELASAIATQKWAHCRQEVRWRSLKWCNLRQRVRTLADDYTMRSGLAIVGFCAALAAGVILSNLMHLDLRATSATSITLALSAGTGLVLLLYRPSDSTLGRIEQQLRKELADFEATIERANQTVSSAKSAVALEHDRDQIAAIVNSRCARLLREPWMGFAGLAFERFLVDVFAAIGYDVEHTGKSGDQGADLLLSANQCRFAVQAKGYPGSTVGNSAVQQAHAAMGFHGCQVAVVVTNSTYTRSARELADKLRCRLIDKDDIPLLLRGELRLDL